MSTQNHQGELNDSTDESDGKIFEVNNSSRCPVKAIENFVNHLNPKLKKTWFPKGTFSSKYAWLSFHNKNLGSSFQFQANDAFKNFLNEM